MGSFSAFAAVDHIGLVVGDRTDVVAGFALMLATSWIWDGRRYESGEVRDRSGFLMGYGIAK